VLLGQSDQDRDEEAVREDELALGIVAVRRDLHGLQAQDHAAIGFPTGIPD
jgi:hypothetical protein